MFFLRLQRSEFSRKLVWLVAFSLVLTLAATAFSSSLFVKAAATYEVGPGKPFAQISQVVNLLQPGDTVLVYANGSTPYNTVTFGRTGTSAAPITIKGVRDPGTGQRPIISDSTSLIVVFTAGFYIFEGFEVTTSSNSTDAVIAINPFKTPENTNRDIVIRDSLIRDCPGHGILSNDFNSGSILLSHIEVARCGSGTFDHAIYVTTGADFPTAVFQLEFSYIHDSRGGNLVKSRSKFNKIYYNWLESGPNNGSVVSYQELELIGPDNGTGGSAQDPRNGDVVGNVLVKKNDFSTSVRIGGDGTGASYGRYRFVNNTFVLNNPTPNQPRNALRVMDRVQSLELENNVFTSRTPGGVNVIRDVEAQWLTNPRAVAGKNNWVAPASNVPAEFQATIVGGSNDPGFTDLNNYDVRPKEGSSLINNGTNTPLSPPGQPFPLPFALPTFHPSLRQAQPPGVVNSRPLNGVVDIGAFEALAAPSVSLSFNPASFRVGLTSGLIYTLSNPNGATLSGVAFSHTLSTGLKIAANPALSNSCSVPGSVTAQAGTGSVGVTGLSLAPNQTCTISVQISSNTVGSYNTATGPISATESGAGVASNTASVQVIPLPPVASLNFSPATIVSGTTTTLTYTITNSNGIALSGLTFSDTLPSQLPINNPPSVVNSCGGSLTANAGASQVSLSGGSLSANGSCTVSLNLRSSQVGNWFNQLEAIGAAGSGAGVSSSFVGLVVVAPLYSATPIGSDNLIAVGAAKVGTSREMTLTIANVGHPITSLGVTLALQGPNSGVFSLTTNALTLSGGQSNPVKITCTPPNAGLITANLAVTTNPAGLAPASYTLQCWGGSKVVTKNVDDNTVGTLSEALASANTGDVIVFELPPANQTITFSQPVTLELKTGVVLDAGCTNGPVVTLDGTGQTGDGLRITGSGLVSGLRIYGFGKRQLVATGANRLSCVMVKKAL